ncbi:MAG: hypothetical protein NNA23_09420 [Nitrospira sp.]|nr:hypothetical protein [Nitrospira sp.]
MNSMKSLLTTGILGLGLCFASGQTAQATQAVWDVNFTPAGWTRGVTPGSLYAEWNVFNDDIPGGNIQDTTPEVANFGGGTYRLEELTGTAFLTSGGNIYSIGFPTEFVFTTGNMGGEPSDIRDVYLRVGSLGRFDSTLNASFTNFLLNGIGGTYSVLYTETISGGFGGSEVEALVSWLGVPNASSFRITWNAVGSAVSLDQLSIDIGPGRSPEPIPVPGAVYLFGSGIIGLATMARRKSQAA